MTPRRGPFMRPPCPGTSSCAAHARPTCMAAWSGRAESDRQGPRTPRGMCDADVLAVSGSLHRTDPYAIPHRASESGSRAGTRTFTASLAARLAASVAVPRRRASSDAASAGSGCRSSSGSAPGTRRPPALPGLQFRPVFRRASGSGRDGAGVGPRPDLSFSGRPAR